GSQLKEEDLFKAAESGDASFFQSSLLNLHLTTTYDQAPPPTSTGPPSAHDAAIADDQAQSSLLLRSSTHPPPKAKPDTPTTHHPVLSRSSQLPKMVLLKCVVCVEDSGVCGC
ncbi:hypothetical protein Dimus_033177, partial [Dionaea muscipula]